MATSRKLPSGNWRAQVRRKGRYIAETFRRHKDAGVWALDMERRIDQGEVPSSRVRRKPTTFGDLIDLHLADLQEVVNPFVRLGHPLDNGTVPDLAALFSYPMAGPPAAEPHRAFFDRLSIDHKFPYAVPHLVIDSFSLTLRIVERTDAFSFVFSSYAASPEFQEKFLGWRGWTPFPPLPISLAYRKGWLPTHAAAPLLEILRETTKWLDTSQ